MNLSLIINIYPREHDNSLPLKLISLSNPFLALNSLLYDVLLVYLDSYFLLILLHTDIKRSRIIDLLRIFLVLTIFIWSLSSFALLCLFQFLDLLFNYEEQVVAHLSDPQFLWKTLSERFKYPLLNNSKNGIKIHKKVKEPKLAGYNNIKSLFIIILFLFL